jgi:hypothetical protein
MRAARGTRNSDRASMRIAAMLSRQTFIPKLELPHTQRFDQIVLLVRKFSPFIARCLI